MNNKNRKLELISHSRGLVVSATDGKETIAKANVVFRGWIDVSVKKNRLNFNGRPTKKTPVEVHELVEDGTFKDIFGCLNRELDDLCLSQSQIVEFVNVNGNRGWIDPEGCGTFFLFKEEGEYFVAHVLHDRTQPFPGILCVGVSSYLWNFTWFADRGHRIVVPQR